MLRIKKNNIRYELFLENANDLIAILDENLKFEYVNENAYKRILGYDSNDLIGRTPLFMLKPEYIEVAIKDYKEGFERGEGMGVYQFMTKNGTSVWLQMKGKTFIDYDGKVKSIIISREISSEIESKQILREQNRKLRELDDIKNDFMIRSSHELKTPLVAIMGYTELLWDLNADKLDEKSLEYIKEIQKGCKRLNSRITEIITANLLETERLVKQLQKDDLAILIRECASELESFAKLREQTISLRLHEELITLFDKDRIYDVLCNLLNNAIKNTSNEGKIEISSEIVNNSYRILFKDDGVGLTEDEMEKLFNKFGKIERSGMDTDIQGTGLGLFISKHIIEMHNGDIGVQSKGRDKGSTFYFSLPIIS